MSDPAMDSDFQLFSSPQHPGGDESWSDGRSCTQSKADNATQDWTQWMRWDEPMFSDGDSQPMESSLGHPFISPNLSVSSQNQIQQKDFSPRLPLGLIEIDPGPTGASNNDNTTTLLATSDQAGSNKQRGLVSPISSVGTTRKRKSSSDEDTTTMAAPAQPGKKMPAKQRAHNVIEKRYRANLNEKITELRDSVPSLRASKNSNGDSHDDEEGAEGVHPAGKLNKASILSKATKYIKHLEIRNKRLEDENTELKNRLRQVDKAADQAVISSASVSSPSNYTISIESGSNISPSVFSHPEEIAGDNSPTSNNPPQGLIKVPDAWKRMRAEGTQERAFSESYIKYTPGNSEHRRQERGGRRSKLPSKFMLGALAGLMVLEGIGSHKSESEEKGLFGLPFGLLQHFQLSSLAHREYYLRNFWYSWHARAITHFLALAIFIVGSAFLVFVYLFNAEPVTQRASSKTPAAKTAAPTSSVFRRQAWLTSVQRVGVPRHRFFREWYVVTSRCFEYVLRCLMGWKLYSWATGITEEDEKGRVKTWDIAIDAQITGGDPEISKSRLVLTIFAAGTLPRSPMRIMLKALHIRILLWRVGEPGSWSFHFSNDVACALARHQWGIARAINEKLPKDHPDALPSHLAAVVKLDCEKVMVDSVIQRAVNLTWSRPTHEVTADDGVLLDVVEEDPAIQCSVDALAAWLSSHLLQNALLKYFEASEGGPASKPSRDDFKEKISMSLDVAPRLSAAYTRALVMKAVFFEQDRAQNIGAVLGALPKDKIKGEQNHAANFLDSSLPVSVREEISVAVRCAMIAAVVTARSTGDTSLPASFTVEKAIKWFNQLPIDSVELTLLGFSAVYHLLHLLASDVDYIASSDYSAPSSPASEATSSSDDEADDKSRTRANCPRDNPNIGRVAAALIYWVRNAYNPSFYHFSPDHVDVIEKSCVGLCKDAGIDVESYLDARHERAKSKKHRSRRLRGASNQSCQSDVDQDRDSTVGKPLSRERSASNDTGYGSMSVEEDAEHGPNIPEKVQEVSA